MVAETGAFHSTDHDVRFIGHQLTAAFHAGLRLRPRLAELRRRAAAPYTDLDDLAELTDTYPGLASHAFNELGLHADDPPAKQLAGRLASAARSRQRWALVELAGVLVVSVVLTVMTGGLLAIAASIVTGVAAGAAGLSQAMSRQQEVGDASALGVGSSQQIEYTEDGLTAAWGILVVSVATLGLALPDLNVVSDSVHKFVDAGLPGFDVRLIEERRPDEVLTRAMSLHRADAMQIRRRSPAEDDALVRLGAVARRLLRTFVAPVIVCPPDLTAETIRPGAVVVAVRPDDASAAALRFAQELAKRSGRELAVVSVLPPPFPAGVSYLAAPALSRRRSRGRRSIAAPVALEPIRRHARADDWRRPRDRNPAAGM